MSYVPDHFACWFEIPVTDLDAAMAFYSAVFDMELSVNNDGPNPVAFFPVADEMKGISGHLYPGTPSENGPTIHLTVPDNLDAARARIVAAGGKVESPDIPVPAGHFFYARDIDGNSIGLFAPTA
ncbi:MAG: VOC family protein [Pseudomonadota bacterium]